MGDPSLPRNGGRQRLKRLVLTTQDKHREFKSKDEQNGAAVRHPTQRIHPTGIELGARSGREKETKCAQFTSRRSMVNSEVAQRRQAMMETKFEAKAKAEREAQQREAALAAAASRAALVAESLVCPCMANFGA